MAGEPNSTRSEPGRARERRTRAARALQPLAALLGAVAGVATFGVALRLAPPGAVRWLDDHGLALGQGALLPALGLLWLACAGGGAALAMIGWRRLVARRPEPRDASRPTERP